MAAVLDGLAGGPGLSRPVVALLFTTHGWFVVVHGMLFGGLFLASLAGAFVALLAFRPDWLTIEGRRRLSQTAKAVSVLAAAAGWATVLMGAFTVDPLFHGGQDPPAHILESYSGTMRWVTWAMPGKEDLALMSILLASAAAVAVLSRGERLAEPGWTRRVTLTFFGLAFVFASTAALLGAFLAKVGPIV
jgi:hypothetical protein